MTLPQELKQQILAEAARRPSPTRREALCGSVVAIAAAVLVTMAVFWTLGGVRPTGRTEELMIGTAAGALAIAAGALWLVLHRGRSMSGRPAALLLALVVVAPGALLLWKLAWSSRFPGMTVRWPERVGLRCFWLSLAMATPPLLALLWVRRRTAVTLPGVAGAALGAATGAAVWLFVDLWCPVAYPPHLWLGHVLPLCLAVGAGALLGRLVLGISRPRFRRSEDSSA